ncbi:sulfurtransferase TusA family protein [Rubellimicrobium arenae]|uniref:sulfurtransferase TusA family protein n=1 Tax=Rubellimicrobium arenae TaxID=2817372 RepID=UPI001B30279B
MTPDREVDARGLICPLPVLRARKILMDMKPGQILRLLADDAMAAIDLPHFCIEAGHEHLALHMEDGAQVHLIRRGEALKS